MDMFVIAVIVLALLLGVVSLCHTRSLYNSNVVGVFNNQSSDSDIQAKDKILKFKPLYTYFCSSVFRGMFLYRPATTLLFLDCELFDDVVVLGYKGKVATFDLSSVYYTEYLFLYPTLYVLHDDFDIWIQLPYFGKNRKEIDRFMAKYNIRKISFWDYIKGEICPKQR